MKFPLSQVLSVTSGRLFCTVDELYKILNFLTNDDLFTHQLIRASYEATPHILRAYPKLKDYDVSEVNRDNWKEKLQDAEAVLGKLFELDPIPMDDHARKDPRQELIDMVGKDKVIEINLDEEEDSEQF